VTICSSHCGVGTLFHGFGREFGRAFSTSNGRDRDTYSEVLDLQWNIAELNCPSTVKTQGFELFRMLRRLTAVVVIWMSLLGAAFQHSRARWPHRLTLRSGGHLVALRRRRGLLAAAGWSRRRCAVHSDPRRFRVSQQTQSRVA